MDQPKLSEKSNKFVGKFNNVEKPILKRLKHVQTFFSVASPEELSAVTGRDYAVIYSIILGCIQHYEKNAHEKGKVYLEHCLSMLDTLQTLLTSIPHVVQKKWQLKSIGNLCNRLLAHKMQHPIRMRTLKILLNYVSVYGENILADEFHNEIFVNCFNFTPFSSMFDRAIALPEFPQEPFQLGLSATTPTINECMDMLKTMFDWITERPDSEFEVWYILMLRSVYTVLFPRVCPGAEGTGFLDSCPLAVLNLNMTHVDTWLRNATRRNVMFGTVENVPVVLEFFRQTSALPLSDHKTTQLGLRLYRYLLIDVPTEPILNDFQFHYQAYIMSVYDMMQKQLASLDLSDPQVAIARDCFAAYQELAVSPYVRLADATLQLFHSKALEMGTFIVVSITSSPLLSSWPMGETVVGEVVATLLLIWVSTNLWQPSGWKSLQSKIEEWKGHLSVVKQWGSIFTQSTELLIDKLYKPMQPELKKVDDDDVVNRRRSDLSRLQLGGGSEKFEFKASRGDLDFFQNIEFEPEEHFAVWEQVLHVIGDPNTIPNHKCHGCAIRTVASVVQMFLDIGSKVAPAVKGVATPTPPRPPDGNDLMSIFGAMLVDACRNSESVSKEGRHEAYKALCRIFCHGNATKFRDDFLHIFFHLVHKAFISDDKELITDILLHSQTLFSINHPGVNVLIQDYVKHLGYPTETSTAEQRKAMLKLLGSMIFFSYHFTGSDLPDWSYIDSIKGESNLENDISFNRIDFWGPKFASLLQSLVNGHLVKETDTSIKVLSVWGVALLVYEDLNHELRVDFLRDSLQTLQKQTTHENDDVSSNAVDALGFLSVQASRLWEADSQLITNLLRSLCTTVLMSVASGRLREQLVQTVVSCITKWVLVLPSTFVATDPIMNQVFNALEAAIQRGSMSASVDDTAGAAVKECAFHALSDLNNLFNHFPTCVGPAQNVSKVSELDDVAPGREKEVLTFTFKDSSVFSFVPIEDDAVIDGKVRVIIRDMTGKYAWDVNLGRMSADTSVERFGDNDPRKDYFVHPDRGSIDYDPTFKEKPSPLQRVITYIESLPDCAVPSEEDHLRDLKQNVVKTESMEKQIADMKWNEPSTGCDFPLAFLNPRTSESQFRCSKTRFLMHQMGLLSEERMPFLRILDRNDKKAVRAVETLDETPCRETHKFGVIYVQPGQENQSEILFNDHGSADYEAFVDGLGWPVDLGNHAGFIGGLDRKLTTGKTAPYYATQTYECIFHVATRMPTVPNDKQQILKKRHVGNDSVVIIWTEHKQEYRPMTIKSQFNRVHIVVHPLENNLCRIRIHGKEKVPPFGPLGDGMVVNKKSLPLLVRETALHASRVIQRRVDNYKRPYTNRREIIESLIEKYGRPFDVPEILEASLKGTSQ